MVERVFEDVVAWAQGTKLADGGRVIDQEWVRLDLARVHARLELVKLLNWKVAAAGSASPADASATKVLAPEFSPAADRPTMGRDGPASLPRTETRRDGQE